MVEDNGKDKVAIRSHKKHAFLENYPKFNFISKTAQAIGISERIVYFWIKKDENFSQAFQSLKKEVEEALVEAHERDVDDISFNPKTPANVRILGHTVRLNALAPDRYRPKAGEAKLTGDITIKLNIPERKYPQIDSPKVVEVDNKALIEGEK